MMKLILTREKAGMIKKTKHPWIFRNAIATYEGEVGNGVIAEVCDHDRTRIGFGFYSSVSKIACRMIGFQQKELEHDWVEQRLHSAFLLRQALKLQSNAYRLINAEGDFFPGLIVDVYNATLVVRPLIRGTEIILPEITAILGKLFPDNSIYLKRDEKASRVEKLELKGGYLKGNGEGKEVIEENGILFHIDIREGQKTGFYLDQRDNRLLLVGFAERKRVLNLFSYTGAFSIYALKGGASGVDSVDSSSAALELARKNISLNKFAENEQIRIIEEDGFRFLEKATPYDIVILDPPPFARSRAELDGALRGYRRLNAEAMRLLLPHGFLFTFSCSGAVTPLVFKEILFEAAEATGKRIQIIRELHASSDHPYNLHHSEGEYLKGFIIYAP
jgi:23S rRNA (cytosine1962-C5)-methyltransferase